MATVLVFSSTFQYITTNIKCEQSYIEVEEKVHRSVRHSYYNIQVMSAVNRSVYWTLLNNRHVHNLLGHLFLLRLVNVSY